MNIVFESEFDLKVVVPENRPELVFGLLSVSSACPLAKTPDPEIRYGVAVGVVGVGVGRGSFPFRLNLHEARSVAKCHVIGKLNNKYKIK